MKALFKKLLLSPISYYLIRFSFLYNIKKVRRKVWMPNPIKIKNLNLFIKRDSNIPRLADLHFLGVDSLNDSFSINIMRKLASKSEVMLDIGADIGLMSLILSDANPIAAIYAFEPSSHSFPDLIENINLNNTKNIVALKLGVGSKDSKETFYYSPENSVISSFSAREGFIAEQIEIKTIESICVEFKINKIDFIKIDIEGFELDALAGIGGKIFNSKPIILAEVLNENNGKKIAPFLPKNYIYFRIVEESKVLKEDKKIDRTSKISNNYLFVPSEKVALLKELSII